MGRGCPLSEHRYIFDLEKGAPEVAALLDRSHSHIYGLKDCDGPAQSDLQGQVLDEGRGRPRGILVHTASGQGFEPTGWSPQYPYEGPRGRVPNTPLTGRCLAPTPPFGLAGRCSQHRITYLWPGLHSPSTELVSHPSFSWWFTFFLVDLLLDALSFRQSFPEDYCMQSCPTTTLVHCESCLAFACASSFLPCLPASCPGLDLSTFSPILLFYFSIP